MYFDGSLTIDGAGAETNEQLHYVLRIHFPTSNNAAKYKACFHGLRIAVDLGIKRLYVHGDSTLVINQLNKDWDTTNKKLGSLKANFMALNIPMWSETKIKQQMHCRS
jgi:ribonuclease HI